MPEWTESDLARIGAAEELRIAALRADGSQRGPVIIWVVRHADALYVRSANGRDGSWFRAAQTRHEGHIWAGGGEWDVTLVEESGPEVDAPVDAAYRAKYHRYAASIIDHITNAESRAATFRLVRRAE